MQLVLSLSPGGTERLVIEICRQLASRVESMVCCLDEPGGWAAELEALHVPVVALGRQPGFQPSLAVQIARLIKANDIDVVHCHHYSPYVYGLIAARLANVRLVFTEHGRLSDAAPSSEAAAREPVALDVGRARVRGLRRSEAVTWWPKGSRRGASRWSTTASIPVIARRPSSAMPRAKRSACHGGAFVTGTVGRLDPVKNLAAMLRAHALLVETSS